MKERNIVTCILLTIITCGIYGIYWFIVLTDDVVRLSDGKEYNQSGVTAFLFSIITCGIYTLYWMYKMGKSVSLIKGYGDDGILYLILSIFGLGIVSYCLAQNDVNAKLASN